MILSPEEQKAKKALWEEENKDWIEDQIKIQNVIENKKIKKVLNQNERKVIRNEPKTV